MVLILNTVKTINTDSDIVLIDRQGLDQKRIAYVLQNISTGGQKITLSTGAPAVSLQGRTIYVGGTEDRTPEQRPPQQAIYAVSDVAGAIIAIYEESE